MLKIKFFTLLVALTLISVACSLLSPPEETQLTSAEISGIIQTSALSLTKQAQNSTDIFNTVGQTINYRYSVTNTGALPLAGPVIVLDNKIPNVSCPDLSTIGNQDNALDPNETLVCTSTYSITQADLDAGSVTNTATASAGSVMSNQSTVTVTLSPQTRLLSLTKTANPVSYNQVGQTITYTFVITNIGTLTLGPAQFTITDNKLGPPLNCGADNTTLAPNQTVTCTATYTITQADLSAASIQNSATASGGGATTSQPATATITNSALSPTTPSGLTPGATIQHTVVSGEWLIQISRCYGANYNEMRNANPQITNPNFILPGMIITVPRIGSVGRIYGPPCVVFHTVQANETWTSIAQQYNADVIVLQEANPDGIAVGRVLKVPINSAGGIGTQPVGEPIRITIPAGANSITLSGTLSPTGKVRYVLTGNLNQIMDIKVTAPANEVTLGVYDPSGAAIKTPDVTLTWSKSLTANGDYLIELSGVSGTANKNFTITITLTNPTS
ncbi:MAG TPA: LysM peptidoglycan-binding domain-containing protein [Anaerolineales bacterium]|nr:LysM peptidoglycan-binding domain-containing protein [Anaerolineales bacterium]